MLARRVARAEALALASSSSATYRSRSRVGCSRVRSQDAQRARAAPATAALMTSPAATTKTPTRLSSRGLPPSRQAATRPSLAARATPEDGEDGSGSADGEEEGSDDAGNDSDSTSPKTTAANKGAAGGATKRTPALEARKADRLRSQLLSMMPDPVDDPLFDAGAVFWFGFGFLKEGGREREEEEEEVEKKKAFFSSFFLFFSSIFHFPFPGASQVREAFREIGSQSPHVCRYTPGRAIEYSTAFLKPRAAGSGIFFQFFERKGRRNRSRGFSPDRFFSSLFCPWLAGGSPSFFFPIGKARRGLFYLSLYSLPREAPVLLQGGVWEPRCAHFSLLSERRIFFIEDHFKKTLKQKQTADSSPQQQAPRRADRAAAAAAAAALSQDTNPAAAAAAAAWANVGIGETEEEFSELLGGEGDGDKEGMTLPPPPSVFAASLPSEKDSARVATVSAGVDMDGKELLGILEAYHLEEEDK